MALRILTAQEIGERVAEVLRRVGMGSVEMSLAMGRDKQFISRWPTGRRKRVERQELADIAEFAAGRGDFAMVEAETIMDYFDGKFDDWEIAIRPNLRLVGEDGPDPLDSTPPEKDIPGYLNPDVESVAA